jgi:TP901 family phage tail tape measure protein
MTNLGTAYGRIVIDSGGALASINLVQKGLFGLGGSMSAANLAVIGLGAGLAGLAAGGTALAVGIGKSVSVAANLEQQLDGVQAVTGATAAEMKGLKDLITDLGVDPNLKVSAMEAAAAVENLARNGMSVADIMDGGARATVLLANATGGDFAQSADIATNVMALFKIQAGDMEKAVDGITGVVNNSRFKMEDYALAIAQGGGVAAAFGVEFEDFNATIAATSAYFSSGSDAGTSYKTFMQRLIPQSKEAATVMKDLGLITADGANQFYDANGSLKDMTDISVLLNKAMAGLSEEQKNTALTTMFGADASRMAVALAEQGEVAYTDLAAASKELGVSIEDLGEYADGGITKMEALQATMRKTSAADAAATRMDNLRGAMEIFDGIVETLQWQIGDEFIPMLTDGVRALSGLLEQNQGGIVSFFGGIADGVGAVGQVVGPAIADVIARISQLSQIYQAGGLFGGRSGSFATTGLLDALGVSPEMQGELQGVITDVNGFIDWFNAAITVFQAGGLFGSEATFGFGLLDALGVSPEMQGTMETALADINNFMNQVNALMSSYQNVGVEGKGGVLDSLFNVTSLQEAGAEVIAAVPGVMDQIVSAMTESYSNQNATTTGPLSEWATSFWDWVEQARAGAGNALALLVAEIGLWAANPDTQTQLSEMGYQMGQSIINNLKFAAENAGPMVETVALIASGLVQAAAAATWIFVEVGAQVVAGFIAGILNAMGADLKPMTVTEFIEMGNWMGETLAGIDWYQMGADIINGLIEGIRSKAGDMMTAMAETVGLLPETAKTELDEHSPSKLFAGIGENISLGLAEGIAGAAMAPADEVAALTGGLAAYAGGAYGAVDNSRTSTTNNSFSMSIGNITNGEAGVMQGFNTLRALAA